MIDRSYLPYQSAREFQDRGMAKWAGFFLSEHTTALQTKEIDHSQLNVLPLSEQIQLLEQAFQQQTTISITTLEGNQFATYTGSIHTLSASELLLKSEDHYHRMKPIQTKHELQFDYFSENYHQFETDFYKWAATSTPLVFLEDDILHSMAAGQRNYFRLHHTKSRDHRDHYFYFNVSTLSQSPLTRIYAYTGHHLQKIDPHQTDKKDSLI